LEFVKEVDQICPCSKATRGNIDITISLSGLRGERCYVVRKIFRRSGVGTCLTLHFPQVRAEFSLAAITIPPLRSPSVLLWRQVYWRLSTRRISANRFIVGKHAHCLQPAVGTDRGKGSQSVPLAAARAGTVVSRLRYLSLLRELVASLGFALRVAPAA
jgi:hypothetical protein